MTERPKTIAWAIRTTTRQPMLIMETLEAAMAWCEADNWNEPLRWLVSNDALRSAGPYAACTNIGYTISPVEW